MKYRQRHWVSISLYLNICSFSYPISIPKKWEAKTRTFVRGGFPLDIQGSLISRIWLSFRKKKNQVVSAWNESFSTHLVSGKGRVGERVDFYSLIVLLKVIYYASSTALFFFKFCSSKTMVYESKNTFSLIRSLYFPFVDCRERFLAIVAGSAPSFLLESCKFSIESAGIADAIL